MLFPRVKIKRIASASLVLGGAMAGCGGGDGGGGGGGSGVPSTATIVDGLCTHFQDCDPEDFAFYFDSARECAAYFTTYIEELEDQQGERCGRAIRAYYDCLLEADQGMCMDEEELFDSCASEYARFLNLCYY